VWRYFAPAGAFLALGAVLAFALMRIGQGKLDVHEIRSPLLGKTAPAFVLPSVTDPSKLVDSRSLAGKMYVFNVWGTWCAACQEEHSALLTIASTAGIPIIGLDWKDERESAVQYLDRLGNPYQDVVSDADGRIAIEWGVYGAPETFLVSAAGSVLVKHIGAITKDVWQEKFAPHLKPGVGS
jgi:cytochrome c biogenesis protein CcmG, thiol:disulfide interchange protein DsbE